MKKLHLGCGAIIINGWVNLDLNPPEGGTVCDLRRPLPYESDSVDFIFHEHFIEHLTRDEGVRLTKECYRVLKPDGVLRIITPDLYLIAKDYLDNKIDRSSEIWNPATPCQMLNGAMRLWAHQFLYDNYEMMIMLRESGFIRTVLRGYKMSGHTELLNIDQRPHHEELILEATK